MAAVLNFPQNSTPKAPLTPPCYANAMNTPPPPLPFALDQSLRRALVTGEQLLWRAQPRARGLLGGFWIWVFAIPWTLFSLGWEAAAFLPWLAETKTPDAMRLSFGIVFPLFGLPFILIGLWMLWTPIRAMRQAKLTVYGLTNRRLLRLVEGRKREVSSVLLDQIGPLTRHEKADGSGHLSIQTHSRVDSDGDRITEKFDIWGVPGVAQLERLILENRVLPPQ